MRHDGRDTKVRLKDRLNNSNASEYIFAQQKIKVPFNLIAEDVGDNTIYELEYFYEKGFEIKLSDTNYVSRRLKKYAYCFVSHQQYDVNLTERVKDFVACFAYCVKHFLEVDLYDEKAISEIKALDKSYTNNPRKRLFMNFSVVIDEKGFSCVANENEEIYKPVFAIDYKSKKSKPISNRKYTSIATRKQTLANSPEGLKQLINLVEYIKSIIWADIIYILGEEVYTNFKGKFSVDVNILRTEVGLESAQLSNISNPTPQGPAQSLADYQVIHLLHRDNVTGGVNHIKYSKTVSESNGDYFLLNKPMDSAFMKNSHKSRVIKSENQNEPSEDNNKVNIFHNTKVVILKEGAKYKYGYRDVIVIEIKEDK